MASGQIRMTPDTMRGRAGEYRTEAENVQNVIDKMDRLLDTLLTEWEGAASEAYANKFAEKYKLHGLFSGMIISELQEAIDLGIRATKDEIDTEMEKFTIRLKDCMETYGVEQTPIRMKELDDVRSPLTTFNYGNLYYYE